MIVGEAKVVIKADTSKLLDDIKKQLKGLDKLGEDVGKKLGEDIAIHMADALSDGIDDLGDDLRDKFDKKGATAGKAFGKAFNSAAVTQINALPSKVNATKLGRDIATGVNAGFGQGLDLQTPVNRNLALTAQNANQAGQDAANRFNDGFESVGAPNWNGPSGNFGNRGSRAGDSFGSGFVRSFEKWMNQRSMAPFEGMIRGLLDNMVPLAAMSSLIYGVVGAVMSLINAIAALAATAAGAVPALGAFGNIFSALIQGGMVMKSVFGGVGAAMSAYKQQTKQASVQTESLLERLLRIAQARLALKRAVLAQGRTEIDVQERISDAMDAYLDALRAEQRAQRAVGDARDAAREKLEDLALELEGSVLGEERAILNLKKAEKALAEARAGGNLNAIYEADLAYREQEFAVRKLQESNQDLREESSKAQAAGVDGSQEVLDAQREYLQAIERTSDALRELQRAQEDAPLDLEESILRVQQAVLALQKAMLPQGGAANAVSQLQDAMAELSPAARDFVRYWQGKVSPLLKSIKWRGQDEFFPRLTAAIETLLDSRFDEIIGDMFANTAAALGELTKKLAGAFAAPPALASLEKIFASNVKIINIFGDALATLVAPMLKIGEALIPLAERMADRWLKAAESFAEFIDTSDKSGKLKTFLESAEKRMLALKEMFKAFGAGLKIAFEAALPAGDYLVQQLTDMARAWSENVDQDALADTFMRSAENAVILLDVITDIGGWLFRMGGAEGIGPIASAIKEILPELERLAGVGFNDIADAIARIILTLPGLFSIFTDSAFMETFFGALATTLETISGALQWISDSTVGSKLLEWTTYALGVWAAVSLIAGVLGHIGLKFITAGRSAKNFAKMAVSPLMTVVGVLGKVTRAIGQNISAWAKGNRAAKNSYQQRNPGARGGLGGWWDRKTDRQSRTTSRTVRQATRRRQQSENADRNRTKLLDKATNDIEKEAKAQQDRLEKIGKKYGMDLTNGIREGIEEAFTDSNGVLSITQQQLDRMVQRIQAEMGIASPSRVMMEKVGEPMGEGIGKGAVQGIQKTTDDVANAGKSMGEAVQQSFGAGLDMSTEVREDVAKAKGAFAQAGAEIGASAAGAGSAVEESFGAALNLPAEVREDVAKAKVAMGGAAAELAAPAAAMGSAAEESFGAALNLPAEVREDVTQAKVALGAAAGELAVSATTAGNAVEEAFGAGVNLSQEIREETKKAKVALAVAGAELAVAGAAAGAQMSAGFNATATLVPGAAGKGAVGKGAAGAAGAAGKTAAGGAAKKGLGGALAKLGAKAAAKQAIGSIIPGVGNVLMALWTIIDVVMLVVMFFPQISEAASKAFSAIGDFWNEKVWPVLEKVKGFFSGIIDWIKEKFDLKTVLMGIIAPIPTLIFNVGSMLFDGLKGIFGRFTDWIKKNFDLKNLITGIFGGIPALFGNLISNIFTRLPEGIKGPVLKAYNWVAEKLNTALGWLSRVPLIPDIPKLPIMKYAEGGYVGGVYRGGDSVPALLTPGEYVLTRGMVQQAGISNLEQWRTGNGSAAKGASSANIPVAMAKILGREMLKAFLPLFKKVVDLNRGIPIYGTLLVRVYNWLKAAETSLSKGVPGGSKGARDTGVQYFAHGGPVRGRYRGTDTVRAMVTPGEYVLPRFVVQRLGLKRLEDMRRGMFYPMGGSLLQDIPLSENWVQKELERLLKYFREQEKYNYLKISSNEDAFREKLSAALTLQLEGKKKAYDLAQQQLNMRQVQEKAMTAFRIPEWANEREIYDLVPPSYLETELSKVYRGPAVTSLTELLRQKTDLEVADAQEVATRLILNEQVEQELFADYLKYLADKAAQELADKIAQQQPPAEPPSTPPPPPPYQPPPPPPPTSQAGGTSGQVDAIKVLNGARFSNYDPTTRQRWHYPLTKYWRGSTWNEHRPPWAIDFPSTPGIDVVATQYGTVAEVGDRGLRSYGKYLYIDHHDYLRSVYAHLHYIDSRIKKGVKLLAGSRIGTSGFSGGVRPPGKAGAHLHFELWRPRGSNGKGSTYYNLSAKGVKIDKPRGLAEGGIVAATSGGIPAILAEGGRDERVTPLDSKGRSATEVEMLRLMETLSGKGEGIVVHNYIYPAQGMSERELAAKVSREITYQQRRRS